MSFPPLKDLEHLSPSIIPEYGKIVAGVFHEATVEFLTCYQNIPLLSAVLQNLSIENGCPSCVPRWGRSYFITVLNKYASGGEHALTGHIFFQPGIIYITYSEI